MNNFSVDENIFTQRCIPNPTATHYRIATYQQAPNEL